MQLLIAGTHHPSHNPQQQNGCSMSYFSTSKKLGTAVLTAENKMLHNQTLHSQTRPKQQQKHSHLISDFQNVTHGHLGKSQI